MNMQRSSEIDGSLFRTRRHFFRDCGVGIGKIALASLLARDASSATPTTTGMPLVCAYSTQRRSAGGNPRRWQGERWPAGRCWRPRERPIPTSGSGSWGRKPQPTRRPPRWSGPRSARRRRDAPARLGVPQSRRSRARSSPPVSDIRSPAALTVRTLRARARIAAPHGAAMDRPPEPIALGASRKVIGRRAL